MGRNSWSSRNTVEQCLSVGIPFLNENGYFCGLTSGNIQWKNWQGDVTSSISIMVSTVEGLGKYVQLQYAHTDRSTGAKTPFSYKVDLVTTPCNYGGLRYWFVCPLVTNGRSCQRRTAKLYLPPGGKYFGCRRCYNLTYWACKRHRKPTKWLDAVLGMSSRDFEAALKVLKKGHP